MSALPDYVIQALFLKLFKARWYQGAIKACCAFHDEATPSMTLSETEEGVWLFYCFGCGKGGSINQLCKKLGIDYYVKQDYTKRTSSPLGTSEEPYSVYRLDMVSSFPAYYDYFLSRGISAEVCRKFNFRFDFDRNAAVLPVTTNGNYLGYILRYMHGNKRYEIERGLPISQALWGYDFCVEGGQPTYLMEGIIDAAIFWSQGYQAMALCNKTYKSKLSLLKTVDNLHYVPDNYDPQSFTIFNEIRKECGGKMIFVPLPYKDTGEYVGY